MRPRLPFNFPGSATRGHCGLVSVLAGGCSNRAPGLWPRLRAVVQRAGRQFHSWQSRSLYQPSV